MVSLSGLVHVVVFLLIAAAVLGLLWFLIDYSQRNIGGPPLIYNVIRVVFVFLLVLGLIFFLLSLTPAGNGGTLFRA